MNRTSCYRSLFFLFLLLSLTGVTLAEPRSGDNVWDRIDRSQLGQPGIDNARMPIAYETFRLNRAALQALLNRAPEEYTIGGDVIFSLPMPDGSYSRFRIEHSLVVERGLTAKFPELGATYRGKGLDDPTATARFDFLPSGFHSMILSASGTVIVNPYAPGDTDNYISFFKRDMPAADPFRCDVNSDASADGLSSITKPYDLDPGDLLPDLAAPDVASGTQLRTYRLALAATNEYCVAVGGNTLAGSLAAQVLIMNRVNGVYERDLAIHMNIIANNNLIVYAGDNLVICPTGCTAANDPYTNTNGSTMLGQNTTNLNAVIGTANYDIGHVFSTGGGGVATLNGPCGTNKARGVTGLPSPLGDPFAIDYVAHEMGHQWGGNHTFNGGSGSCAGGNRAASAAYEPGSGITIMAYAGICGNQDLAQHSIDTFHVKSLEEIIAYSQTGNGNTCAVTTASGNTLPVVTGPGSFTIPKGSPFALTASATDANGDSLTYDWEEYDLGPQTTAVPNTDSDGNPRPIFRPYLPATSGTRTFPSLPYILNNANVPPSTFDCGRGAGSPCLTGELLPAITRTMLFKVVVRDNRAGAGGVNSNTTSTVTVDGTSGPFAVTSPNTGVSYVGNSVQTVTWSVANTTNGTVNAQNVKISFSSDGGLTFPTVLLASTSNDGTESVTIPNTPTTTARIKVEAVGNIFFDISDTNFTVTAGGSPTPTPQITGNVDYAIVSKPVANVKLDAPGSIPLMVLTDTMGNYSLSGFGSGAYTVTPSRTAQPCVPSGPNGIFANDAGLVSQHVVDLITLSPDQQIAGKAAGPLTPQLSALDAAFIAQKTVGLCSGNNLSGQWVFSPASVAHPGGVTGSLTENYKAIMIGDVNGDWNPAGAQRPETPRRFGVNDIAASVPVMNAARGSDVLVPFRLDSLGNVGVGSYQFDLVYDPSVITPAPLPPASRIRSTAA